MTKPKQPDGSSPLPELAASPKEGDADKDSGAVPKVRMRSLTPDTPLADTEIAVRVSAQDNFICVKGTATDAQGNPARAVFAQAQPGDENTAMPAKPPDGTWAVRPTSTGYFEFTKLHELPNAACDDEANSPTANNTVLFLWADYGSGTRTQAGGNDAYDPDNVAFIGLCKDYTECADCSAVQPTLQHTEVHASHFNNNDPVDVLSNTIGQDFAQTDANRQPIFLTNRINTKPAVSFDGNQQFMWQATGGWDFAGGQFSIFAVVSPAVADAFTILGANREMMPQLRIVGRRLQLLSSLTDAFGNSDTDLTLDAWVVVGVVYDGTKATYYLGNTADGVVTKTLDFASGVGWLGAQYNYEPQPGGPTEFFRGEIAEVLVWDKALIPPEVDCIVEQLETEYNL